MEKDQEITGEVLPSDEDAAIEAGVRAHRNKLERARKCDMAIQAALEQHQCHLAVMFQTGNGLIPIHQIITLPVAVKSESR